MFLTEPFSMYFGNNPKQKLVALAIMITDNISDAIVAQRLFSNRRRTYGWITLGILQFSFVIQALVALAVGEGLLATTLGLFGAKPFLQA